MSEIGEQPELKFNLLEKLDLKRELLRDVLEGWMYAGKQDNYEGHEYTWELDGYRVTVESNWLTDLEYEEVVKSERNCIAIVIHTDQREDGEDDVIAQIVMNLDDPTRHTIYVPDCSEALVATDQLSHIKFSGFEHSDLTGEDKATNIELAGRMYRQLFSLFRAHQRDGVDSLQVITTLPTLFANCFAALLDPETELEQSTEREYVSKKKMQTLVVSSGVISIKKVPQNTFIGFEWNDDRYESGIEATFFDDGDGIIRGKIGNVCYDIDLDECNEEADIHDLEDALEAYDHIIDLVYRFCELEASEKKAS